MKKFLGIVSAFTLTTSLFAHSALEDVTLFNQLTQSYNSHFYPGVVQYAERLEEKYSDSAFMNIVYLMEGESLVRLNRVDEAENILKYAERYASSQDVYRNNCKYWLARVYDAKHLNELSLQYYFDYCALSGIEGEYYASSILNAARIYYSISDYNKAIPLLEYTVSNGIKYAHEDYIDALLKLMDSYNKTNPSKAISLYSKISKDDIDKLNVKSYVYYLLSLYAGEAYESKGEYRKAYDKYCLSLTSGEKLLASVSLKKAYNVSVNHRKEVGEESGAVLASSQKYLIDNPGLLAEFWTRLASDAFRDGDYNKAITYFDEAEKNAPLDLFLYAALYRAQIAGGKNPDKISAHKAEEMILNSRGFLNEENSKIWNRESYILLTKYAAIQNHWNDVKKYASNVNPLDEDTKFYLGLAYYSTKEYDKANNLLKGKNINLHALSYARKGDLKNAAFVYANKKTTGSLSEEEKLNLSKVLLLSGRYNESQKEAAKCNLNEAKYILGLAQFNTWSWFYAEDSFKEYLKASKNEDKYNSYALFYLGYSQYRQGKTKEAYENLSKFVSLYPKQELYWNGLITASNACIQNGDNENALKMALKSIKASSKQTLSESVLLCADIYIDSKNYDEAINLLTPYSKEGGDLGVKSLYKIGQIYERQNKYEDADKKYNEVSLYSSNKISEEALYRRGEIFYNNERYDEAVKRFEEYSKKYPQGSFVESSWYYSAECLSKSGNIERAILQNQALLKKFPQSTYVYSAAKNLVVLYRQNKNYTDALYYANFLMEKYGTEASNDKIKNMIYDLERLKLGKSEEIVKLENDYADNKEDSTQQGRIIGTELAVLYYQSANYKNDGVTLCRKLLPLQQKNLKNESLQAAITSELLAKDSTKKDKMKNASEYYLLSCQYYRMNSKDNEAASCLYGAYTAFKAQGLEGDANETAKTLKTLYPESRYAESVRIVENIEE